MSAVLRSAPFFRPMNMQDLDAIMRIEREAYPYPWSKGNFRDSLAAGYNCWVYEHQGGMIAYAVMMLAAGEAHLLNLCVATSWQGRGVGRKFMEHLIALARDYHAEIMFLEVRPSNEPARRLYEAMGFSEIAVRKNYYPARGGRENAIVMGLSL